jgi:arginyl-tRNA synthetase
MKETLHGILEQALNEAKASGELRLDPFPPITFEIPKREGQGDLATPVAMGLSLGESRAPRQVAQIIVKFLRGHEDLIEKVEVAGPGYINFHIHKTYWREVLREILIKGESFGRSDFGKGQRVLVEFVSANPTGPLHVGHGRGGAVGDVLANLLAATGHGVQREYYVNDAGTQMEILGKSVLLRYQSFLESSVKGGPDVKEEVSLPEGCYQGQYIMEIAREMARQESPDVQARLKQGDMTFFSEFAKGYLLKEIQSDLQDFGIRFDTWMSERRLYDDGIVDHVIADLKKGGFIYEREGAEWLKTTDFGDDKDRVIRRSNEQHTYFASDIAYHGQKYSRGFQRVIDVWGADHHGYIPRMKAAVQILGRKREDLEILLIQLVNLLRAGKPVAMSTRAGEFVTLREVVEEVGRDAARFIFLMRRCDSPLDFDLELAKKQSAENPVYYVQYAHARVCSLEEMAVKQGIEIGNPSDVDLEPLQEREELILIKQLSLYPELVDACARTLEPHRLTFYLQELAASFHNYYYRHRILTDNHSQSLARLALALSIRVVIANALQLLGVSAPKRM